MSETDIERLWDAIEELKEKHNELRTIVSVLQSESTHQCQKIDQQYEEVERMLTQQMKNIEGMLANLQKAIDTLRDEPKQKLERAGRLIGLLVSIGALTGIVWGFLSWLVARGILK